MVKHLYRIIVLFAFLCTLCCAMAQGTKTAESPKPHPDVLALIDQGRKLATEFKFDEAIKIYSDALKKAIELNDLVGQGMAHNRTGNAYYQKGDLTKAGEAFVIARDLFKRAGAEFEEMGTLGNIAIIRDRTGHPEEARPIYLELLKHYRTKGDRRYTANMLLNLAILEDGIDASAAAMQYAKEAVPIYEEIKEPRWVAVSMNIIGSSQKSLGLRDEAIKTYNQVVAMAEKGGFKGELANALGSLGTIERERGNLLKALELHRKGNQIYKETNNLRYQATTLANMAVDYDLLSQSDLAIDHFEQSIAILRTLGDRPSLAVAIVNMGVCLNEAGRNRESRIALLEALELLEAVGDETGQAGALGTLGSIAYSEKNYTEALRLSQKALPIFQKFNRKEGEAGVLDRIANVYADTNRYPEAIDAYKKSVALYTELGTKIFAANTLSNVARLQVKQGKLDEAEKTYRTCIQMFEDARETLGGNEGKSAFMGRKLKTYHTYMELLIQRGKTAEAFDLAQKTKGRSLLDLLSANNVSIHLEMTAAERKQEQALRAEADRINAQMVKEGAQNELGAKKRFEALKVELAKAERRLSAFTANLYAKHPELARKRSANTATLAQIGAVLPKDTVLLEYIVTEDAPVVFVVTARKGKATVQVKKLGLKGAALAAKCSALRDSLSNPALPYQAASKALYQALIQPASAQLVGKNRVVICPDASLWDVPFAVLQKDKFLAEKFEIAYAYSATAVEAALRPRAKSKATKGLLALANPDFGGAQRFGDNPLIPGQRPIEPPSRPIEPPSRPIDIPSRPIEPPSRDLGIGLRGGIVALPGTQVEANALARLFPGATVLTGMKAQEGAFVQRAGNFHYLHIASHAFFNDASPMLSSIVLAIPDSDKTDGYLTAREIFDLKLNADLAVLSACNTARGVKKSGEGIVGLSWALFAAGVPAQVVSQWSVDDKATAALMTRFYRNMKQGSSKAAALRSASVSLMNPKGMGNDPKWRHPYYWAPFIILGDWR